MTKVDRDAYFVIYATMRSGFECKIPARGYNLKSWLAFEEKLGNTYYYEQTTEDVYKHLVFGDPEGIIEDEGEKCQLSPAAGTKSKTSTTASTSPRKRGVSTKKVGTKPSTTKASVKRATKTTKPKAPSSTPTKKKPTGLKAKEK